MKNFPATRPHFSGAVIDPDTGRVVAILRDLANWLGVADNSIRSLAQQGLITLRGNRFYDAAEAAEAVRSRRKVGRPSFKSEDGFGGEVAMGLSLLAGAVLFIFTAVWGADQAEKGQEKRAMIEILK